MNALDSSSATAIWVAGVSHRYGQRQALREVSFEVGRGEIFAFLGPNGGGKSTLFRLLSTLIPLQQGRAAIFGYDVREQTLEVRCRLGVVFQAPSLDKKLTVAENIRHQAALYGMAGAELRRRQTELLQAFGLEERAAERAETLSGGLRRRVELAKGMVHGPQLLLLDEPSTGLDPGVRSDLWRHFQRLREQGVTVVLTTHLLDEADRADRIAILSEGRLVALDTPEALRKTVGGDSITIKTSEPVELARRIADQFNLQAAVLDGQLRLEQTDGHALISRLIETFPESIDAITLGKPSLEDVFIARTGRRLSMESDG